MHRRDFLKGSVSALAIAAVAPAALAATRLFPGEMGRYEGIRFVEGGVSPLDDFAYIDEWTTTIRDKPVPFAKLRDGSLTAAAPRPAIEDWR